MKMTHTHRLEVTLRNTAVRILKAGLSKTARTYEIIGTNQTLKLSWHPNILSEQKLAAGITTSKLYDESLQCFIESKLPISRDALAYVLSALVNAVGHMHKHHLGHFDVKPANILIKWAAVRGQFTTGAEVVLADFGLSRPLQNGEYHGSWLGTPVFCAPELTALKTVGVLKHGCKVDVYAIGVTMSDMFPRLNKRNNVWERQFAKLIAGMTCDDPEKRLSVRQVQSSILKLSDGPVDQFGCLPMSKRAMELLDNVFAEFGGNPKKRRRASPKRQTRASPKKSRTRASPKRQTRVSPKRQTHASPKRQTRARTVQVITTPVQTPVQEISTKIQAKIRRAAEIVFGTVPPQKRGLYKQVCRKFKLNMDSKGVYLGCTGEHYKLIQTAVRTLRRQATNATLTHNTTPTKCPTKYQQVTNLAGKFEELKEHLNKAKQQAEAAEQRVNLVTNERNNIKKKLDETAEQVTTHTHTHTHTHLSSDSNTHPCTMHPCTHAPMHHAPMHPCTMHPCTMHPCTIHHAPMHHAPCTHAPCTCTHTPCTHAPYTMHLHPCTIHHAPAPIHHTPCTCTHTPCTIHHTAMHMHHAP